MLALFNFKTYIFIGLIVGGIMGAIVYFDTGRSFATTVSNTGNTAALIFGGTVTGFITTPITWAATDPYGAIAAGLLWPLAAIWLILFILVFVTSIFAPTITQLPT